MDQNLINADKLLNYVWETFGEGPLRYSKFYLTKALTGAVLTHKHTGEVFEVFVYLEEPSIFEESVTFNVNGLWVQIYPTIENFDFSMFSSSKPNKINRLSVHWEKSGSFSDLEQENLIARLPNHGLKTEPHLLEIPLNDQGQIQFSYFSIDILLDSNERNIDSIIYAFSSKYEGNVYENRVLGIRDNLEHDIHQIILPRFA